MKSDCLEERFRNSIIGIQHEVPLADGGAIQGINFDNAATTPPFYSVIQDIAAFSPWYSSVHRGTGYKSMVSSEIYDEGRVKIKSFVGADENEDLLIYTKSTTESINILANAISFLHPDSVILSTQMEHLANDLPWRDKFCVDYVRVDKVGRLDLDHLQSLLEKYHGRVKLVTVTGASNVTGFINPIHTIAAIAHRHGAEICVDGAQFVPHCAMDMKGHDSIEHIDYLVFSAHKMYAPFGIGILIGPKRSFAKHVPYLRGGGAVKLVTATSVEWDESPYKDEAGTPNVIGVSALLKAVECLKRLSITKIHNYEQDILYRIVDGLQKIDGISLYGRSRHKDKVSIISFTIPDITHRMMATILSYEYGIAVRSGLFCAHPYVQRLLGLGEEKISYYQANTKIPFPGLVRVSLGLYNTLEEADQLIFAIKSIAENKKDYIRKYGVYFSGEAKQRPKTIFEKEKRQLP